MAKGGAMIAVATAVLLIGSAVGLPAQEPLDISHFDGWQDWPLYEAGDLAVDTRGLASQRTVFDFRIPTGDTVRMSIDVFTGMHLRGEPALWIQYLSSGVAGDSAGTSTLDALLVDRGSFRIAFRIQGAPGDRSWTGPYDFVKHRPDRVVALHIPDDGTVETETQELTADPFDFAAMPYLFPFLDLEEGGGVRLVNVGARGQRGTREVAVLPVGRTTVTDALGRDHEVREVQLLSHTGRVLISFYIADEAPYFCGWHYRRVDNGATLSKFDYREHLVMP